MPLPYSKKALGANSTETPQLENASSFLWESGAIPSLKRPFLPSCCCNSVTMNNETPPTYIPCRTEILTPETDWARTWRLARLKGLNSSQTSFLWRLLHRLLPTLDRVNRITPNTSPICKLCPDQTVEDLSHALLSCSYNGVVSTALMNTLSILQPNISKSEILTLHFDVDKQMELPVVWLTCNVLHKIWDSRKD